MRPIQHGGVQLDACARGCGIWLEHGELAALSAGSKSAVDESKLDSLPAVPSEKPRIPRCPVESIRMKTVSYPEAGGLLVDVCPSCHGIWLDPGELERIRGTAPPSGSQKGLPAGDVDEALRQHTIDAQQDLAPEPNPILMWLIEVPIEVYNPIRRTPYATYALVALNALIYFIFVAPLGEPEKEAFFHAWGLVPALAAQGAYYGIFTSMFIHASILHLVGNMYFLWVCGDNIEDRMGPAGFLFVYLLSGIAGGLILLISYGGSSIAVVGASGAISGIIGAYVAFYPKRKFFWRLCLFLWFGWTFRVYSWVVFGIWLALQVIEDMVGVRGVAFPAHIVGFICGFVVTVIYNEFTVRRPLGQE